MFGARCTNKTQPTRYVLEDPNLILGAPSSPLDRGSTRSGLDASWRGLRSGVVADTSLSVHACIHPQPYCMIAGRRNQRKCCPRPTMEPHVCGP